MSAPTDLCQGSRGGSPGPRRAVCRLARWAAAILAAALPAALPHGASALEPTRPVEVRLENVYWQALPDEVIAVFRGPDDRIWYQVFEDSPEPASAEARASIEREFGRPSPHIVGARPALFEPGGRVWFISQSAQMLFGYDGKTWIEKPAGDGRSFIGQCPGHQPTRAAGCNAFVGGRAFFPQWGGVAWYDGKTWSYQAWPFGDKDTEHEWVLVPAQDGREAFALVKWGERSLWRFRDGRWSEQPLPSDDQAGPVEAIAPAQGGGVWLMTSHGHLVQPFGNEGTEAAVAPLLRDLASEEWPVRERATAALAAMGPALKPRLEAALAATKDLEVRFRLQDILEGFRAKPAAVVFGEYRVSNVTLLASDQEGGLIVGARAVSKGDGQAKQGVVHVDAKGACRTLLGVKYVDAMQRGAWRGLPLFWTADRRRLWAPGQHLHLGEPAVLVDPETGESVDQVPDGRFGRVHTVAADGTLFVGWHEPGRGFTVAAYKPGAPDTRRLLEAMPFVALGGWGCAAIADDGAILADVADKGISRFDGRQWRLVAGLESQKECRGIWGGANGSVMADFGDHLALLADGKVYTAPDYGRLIEQHDDAFVRAMRGSRTTGFIGDGARWVIDSHANIWLAASGRLAVWSGGRWLDCAAALRRTGSPSGRVWRIAGLGDGGRVFVYDTCSGDEWGHSFIGEVRGDEVGFVRTPGSDVLWDVHRGIRDPDGGFWVPSLLRCLGTSGELAFVQTNYRLMEEGIDAEVRGGGPPLLCDRSGNVWLGNPWTGRPNEFPLWRKGAPPAQVRVPTGNEYTAFLSDRPGSVWAWTQFGVLHLTADASRPTEYRVAAVLSPSPVEGEVRWLAYSALGYLAAIVHTPEGRRRLLLFPLPGGGPRDAG